MSIRLRSTRVKTLTYIAVGALLLVAFAESGMAFFNLTQADQARRAWQESYEVSARQLQIMSSLRSELGYGGFIHDYKNYILRQKSGLLVQSQLHLQRSEALLDEFSGLATLPDQITATRNIRITLDNYKRALETAEQMVGKNMSSQAIDAAVKVNDRSALQAFAELDSRLEDNRNAAVMAVGSVLSSQAGFSASANIAGTLLMTMLCFLVIGILQNRILAPLARLREVMVGIVQGDFSVPVPDSDRDDEIGEMAGALQIFRDDAEELEELREQHFQTEKKSIIEEAEALVGISRQLVKEEQQQRERLAAEIGRKAAELKRSEALAKGVLDTVSDAFVSADMSGTILGFNRAAEKMFGYEAAEVLNKKINMLMSHDAAVAHDQHLMKYGNRDAIVMPFKMSPDREVLALRKDGTEFPVLITVMVLADGDGETLVATIRDITEESRKLEQINRLGRLVDRSQNAVFTLNAGDFTIQEANARAEETLGYSAEEFIGLSYFDLVGGQTPDDIREYVKPMLAGDVEEIIIEARHIHKDGSTYPMEAHVHYRAEEGSPVFLVVVQDITERLKARAELTMAKEVAETASRAKSTFLANMSHELRTPLNAVIGYSELLLEDTADNGHDQYKADIETISDAGEHLLSLINEVLDLSKIEAGKAKLLVQETDVHGTLHDLCRLVRPQAEANCNNVVLEVDASVDIMWSDETRLRQIIVNLLSNATKFTQDGTITLSAVRAEISGEAHIVFEIADTGIGIADDQIDRIFDEFSQVIRDDTVNPEGTGLGLTICRQLVQLMGGDIRLSSVVGQGTTVTFRLPADSRPRAGEGASGKTSVADEPDDQGAIEADPEASAQVRVLVIEDDSGLRDLMAQFLEREEYVVATASGGVQGLASIEEFKPDVVLLDINLPDLDGREVYRSIRSRHTKEQVRVIFCTGRDGMPVNEIFAENQYLTKPVKRDELIMALQNCA